VRIFELYHVTISRAYRRTKRGEEHEATVEVFDCGRPMRMAAITWSPATGTRAMRPPATQTILFGKP
jgi:hypothetical protein